VGLFATAVAWGTFELLEHARYRPASPPAPALPGPTPVGEGSSALATPRPEQLDFRLPALVGGGLPAPAKAAADGSVGLADLGATVRIVDFWATWCLPCHLQTDVLVKAYPELRARGVEVLAVGVGEDETTVRAYLEKHPVPYPNLLDADDTVLGGRLGVPLLPVILVLDRAGQVAFFDAGILDRPSLEKVLAKAGAPPAPAAG
jgi:thiol-disulfide isomerase/thioredoxin